MVRLYKSVSFDSWLAFNMYPSLWKSVCIINNISIWPCTIDSTTFVVSGKVGSLTPGLTTPVDDCFTPTDRPKSVRNRCVIEVFGGVFVLSISFRIFCWYMEFCHRTELDPHLFLSWETQKSRVTSFIRNSFNFQNGKRIYTYLVLCHDDVSFMKENSDFWRNTLIQKGNPLKMTSSRCLSFWKTLFSWMREGYPADIRYFN